MEFKLCKEFLCGRSAYVFIRINDVNFQLKEDSGLRLTISTLYGGTSFPTRMGTYSFFMGFIIIFFFTKMMKTNEVIGCKLMYQTEREERISED